MYTIQIPNMTLCDMAKVTRVILGCLYYLTELLALISCRLSDACAISVFSLTLTWRCVPKSLSHVQSVLLPFDDYEAYVDLCQTTWCSRSSWRWCCPGLTTAPQLLPVFRSNSWTGFSLCRTPLHG